MQYATLVQTYELLSTTSSRLDKTQIIAQVIADCEQEELQSLLLLLQGRVFPMHDERKLGIASKLVLRALHISSGVNSTQLQELWQSLGDLGDVAQNVSTSRKQSTLFTRALSVDKVFSSVKKLSTIEGKGSQDVKFKMIAELLSCASPLEAKYIVRTLLEDLRVGVGDGTLRDAIAKAYTLTQQQVQEAFDVSNDWGSVVLAARTGSLDHLSLTVGIPIKVMLFQKAKNFEDAFERVGTPAAIEFKYDGFRVQVHKNGTDVQLFTRRLESVTKQFPEVVTWVQECISATTCILDAEIIGWDASSQKFLSFQHISQRIKRKHEIDRLVHDLPVVMRIFDLMEVNGKSYLSSPFQERRSVLCSIVKETTNIHLAEQKIVKSQAEAQRFFTASIDNGNEGVMLKKLDAPYKPGSRVGYGVKVKTAMETLDVVIVGAEWGEGKRSEWLASFTIACRNGDDFLELGKVGTGIKEKSEEGLSFQELTTMLTPLIIEKDGRGVRVKPAIILEIECEEIQKSPSYTSGYALRFPRVIRLREDKPIDQIITLEEVEELYEQQ